MKKIINLCPTGTQTTKENSLAPIYFNEIIDDVLSCYEVGITLVHLHARDIKGNNTYKREVYQKIIDGIKENAPDLVVGVSLSGRFYSDKVLRAEVLSLQPDLASLTMSSLNFPKSASINDPDTILWLIDEMNKYGVNPEIECFDSGMLNFVNYLLRKNVLAAPLYINVILGNLFNAGTDISTVASIINNLPKGAKVCFGGIGQAQMKANVFGLLEADGVRIGLEDNLYYEGKEKTTNTLLLSRISRIMKNFGYSCMSSSEFRSLGYGNRKTTNFRVK
ncbi:3-keto-5-aminohexanoate cleavage protein [Runella sp. SP2]|uniref:3-keto-5-aminohexanoate cleavage protein n=1 Tax=Runella sp. SP2 TaxID=2268026 RepID=UPI000F0833D6|nr:3-keto-5-aminohexanoate cleavage protein [Runella sp. SP2]AYQ31339.1 3-keto-5-aminohexanoate cleavage protein [Runella sp. SP2]